MVWPTLRALDGLSGVPVMVWPTLIALEGLGQLVWALVHPQHLNLLLELKWFMSLMLMIGMQMPKKSMKSKAAMPFQACHLLPCKQQRWASMLVALSSSTKLIREALHSLCHIANMCCRCSRISLAA